MNYFRHLANYLLGPRNPSCETPPPKPLGTPRPHGGRTWTVRNGYGDTIGIATEHPDRVVTVNWHPGVTQAVGRTQWVDIDAARDDLTRGTARHGIPGPIRIRPNFTEDWS